MTPKTHTIIHILFVAATIGLSLVLFIACLFFPAFNLSNNGSFDGFSALLMGWAGVFMLDSNKGAEIAFLGWYANFFFFPAWLGLALSARFRTAGFIGLIFPLVGIGMAACSALVKNILINEAGGMSAVTSMGAGFYIWLVSFAVCVLGYFATIIWSFVKPKNVVATP